MKKIVKENLRLERISVSRSEAKALMAEKGEDYKLILINRVPEGEDITLYRQGEFTDLCAGPHLFATGAVKAFKLTQCTGAYWEGKSENKMLQRVYGVAFPNKEMLNAHLEAVEEAKKRDHNKLGRELELFTTVDCHRSGTSDNPSEGRAHNPETSEMGRGHRGEGGIPSHQNSAHG